MHDFYLSYGFDFSIFSCQANDLGQGFHVLKFMCKLNQKYSARWVSAPEILLVFPFYALVITFSGIWANSLIFLS